MATLVAIGFTLTAGVAVFTISMVSFGIAMKRQNNFIATRCVARPPNVIYNPNPKKDFKVQDRGSPFWGWIPWVMNLSYATLLGGVPGTGTRDGGLSGLMLKVNLDGIVLMRFHHLCFRVCSLAAFLYLVVILPVYKTAQCTRIQGDHNSDFCAAQNLTDYQRLTLANVPPLNYNATGFVEVVEGFFLPVHDGNLARLYAVVFVTWIVTLYAFRELDDEWRDILALRRVYFLEADHWTDRNMELEETLLRDERDKMDDEEDQDDETAVIPASENNSLAFAHANTAAAWTYLENVNGKNRLNSKDEETTGKSSYRSIRDPWIAHPEQRDTVPNVELYSVLVGGLPSLPTEAFVEAEVEAMFSRKQAIDWQLSVTTAFFDHCVPNQPGFSSSVAAVTILPAASQITEAWNHWYKAAAKLRKLRFIRRQIAKLRERQGPDDPAVPPGNDDVGTKFSRDDDNLREHTYTVALHADPSPQMLRPKREKKRKRLKVKRKKKKKKQISAYGISDEKKKYYQDVLGMDDDLDVESNLLHALQLGPEQTAVYSREFAQGAANLAPYGWNEGKVRNAALDELLEMERKSLVDVERANTALREAQDRIAEHSSDGGDNLSDDNLEKIMKRASSMARDDFSDFEFDDIESQNPMDVKKEVTSRPISLENTDDSSGSPEHTSYPQSKDGQQQRKSSMSMLGSISNPLDIVDSIRGTITVVDSTLRGTLSAMDNAGKTMLNFGSFTESNGPHRRMSNGAENTKRSNHANIGLEATLFLKQKQISQSQSLTPSKISSPKRSKSSNFMSSSLLEQKKLCMPLEQENARSRSQNSCEPVKPELSNATDDVKCGTSIRTSVTLSPILRKPSLLTWPSTDRLSTTTLVKNEHPYDTDGASEVHRTKTDDTNVTKVDAEGAKEATIWDKIAIENARRSSLRQRLSKVKTRSLATTISASKKGVHFASEPDIPILDPTTTQSHACFSSKSVPNRRRNDTHDSAGKGQMFSIREDDDGEGSWTPSDFDNDLDAVDRPDFGHSHDHSNRSHSSADDNMRLALDFEEKAGLRNRQSALAIGRLSKTSTEKWSKVVQIVTETARNPLPPNGNEVISSGKWSFDGGVLRSLFQSFYRLILQILRTFQMGLESSNLVNHLASESHYAVVTFTSRQAAVAARHVLADSRGSDRWVTISDIPSPPLADAPVCNATGFRGCVRPVTISINDKQKLLRRMISYALLACIYFFYTFPLRRAQQLVSPESLAKVIPYLNKWLENPVLDYMFSGFIPALVWVAFFAICPPMFKAIANFGSNATSSPKAESSALKYFWWFMVLSAFTGTSLESAIINGFNSGLQLGQEGQKLIVSTAQKIPTEVSATWLNWMIVRVSIVLPTQYLLQLNSFIFTWFGLKCCARAVRGGGGGGPVPYRIYVDSGVVMLCMFALAPASPLISLASFMYFLFCLPMLRWTMIFLYRPRFDLGGMRFPFIFDMCVSGMIVGQILLVTMMALRRAYGPSVAAFLPIIPTITYRWMLRRRYLRAFSDVALLQTSLLDGWDTSQQTCLAKREEFRQFLVDCHKAAYVPVCIASSQATMITSEPAAVIPLETDVEDFDDMTSVNGSVHGGSTVGGGSTRGGGGSVFGSSSVTAAMKHHNPLLHPYRPDLQPGMMMRRASAAGPRSPIPRPKDVHDNIMMTHIDVSANNSTSSHPPSPTRSPLMSPTSTKQSMKHLNQFLSPPLRRASKCRAADSTGKLPDLPNISR